MAEHHSSSKNHTIYIVIIVILLVIVGGEYYYFHNKAASASGGYARGAMMGPGGPGGQGRGGMPMRMGNQKPPTESDQQKAQVAAGTDTASKQKTFNITGGNFYFVPNKITVNEGDQVTFYMTNGGGMHDLVIKELGVKTPVIQSGTTATATFTASKKGSFVYYCDVPGHRQKGMWGTLVVQ